MYELVDFYCLCQLLSGRIWYMEPRSDHELDEYTALDDLARDTRPTLLTDRAHDGHVCP